MRAGLIGAVAIIYLAMVGLIEALDPRKIVGSQLSVAGVLCLGLPPMIAAYAATRPRQVRGEEVAPAVGEAALAGGARRARSWPSITVAASASRTSSASTASVRSSSRSRPPSWASCTSHRDAVSGLAMLSVAFVALGAVGGALRALHGAGPAADRDRHGQPSSDSACCSGSSRPRSISSGLPKAWLYSSVTLG